MSEAPVCPSCGTPVPTEDSDFYCGRTTYWGDGPLPTWECRSCGTEVTLREWVSRWWEVVGSSAAEEE